MYVDELGMNDNEFYPYAYSLKGMRYYEAHPGHRTKRISVIGGLVNKTFQAPFMFEGHCNTATFETYIQQVLVPTLKPGMTVIIDNASFHKSRVVEESIKNAGCNLLFLPPYSPDLNPIEKYWNKLKTYIKKKMRDFNLGLRDAMDWVLTAMSKC